LIREFREAGHACLVAPHMYSFCFWLIRHYASVHNDRFKAYATRWKREMVWMSSVQRRLYQSLAGISASRTIAGRDTIPAPWD
jgi:hypothetical protein